MSKNSKVIYRKIYLCKPPLIYVEDRNKLPDWKKYLLENDDIHFTESNWSQYSHIFEDFTSAVRANAELLLKQLKHTYNRSENSITISREQELQDNRNILSRFLYDEYNVKEMYIEKENNGELWSYFVKQEIDSSGIKKRIAGIKDLSTNRCYVYVNADFLSTYRSGRTITINGSEYPEYVNTEIYGDTAFVVESRMLYYHYYDYICECDGQLLYYAVGNHEEKRNICKSKIPVLKSIEYLEKDQGYRLEISRDTEPAQIKTMLKKLLKNQDVSVIRITGGEHDIETLIYGTEEKYFIAVRDDTGIRFARKECFETCFVEEFGLHIQAMCVVKSPVYINDFIDHIICSDYGYQLMAWVYFYDEQLQFEFPTPDFTQAATVTLPKTKARKPQVVCTKFAYKLNRSTQTLDENKLSDMTARKMYNLAVKKLETGKLSYLSICAVYNEENEQNLVLYGNGTLFSIGIIDTAEESALCYDNGSGDKSLTNLGGQDFPNTMITGDIQLIRDILKSFCDQCLPLDSASWTT